jgi:hypothetical protein
VTSNTFTRVTLVVRVSIAIVPLAVQVVGHIDNIVDDNGNAINRKGFQIPVRCWGGNRNGQVRAH